MQRFCFVQFALGHGHEWNGDGNVSKHENAFTNICTLTT